MNKVYKKISVNDKKVKLKKNALDFVDIHTEKKLDPKYKTELCKSFSDKGVCIYGNKCRFAHGKHELFEKPVDFQKYKLKPCNSFYEFGYCMYGKRCNFKHDERKLNDIERKYYSFKLYIDFSERNETKKMLPTDNISGHCKRLAIFATMGENAKTSETKNLQIQTIQNFSRGFEKFLTKNLLSHPYYFNNAHFVQGCLN